MFNFREITFEDKNWIDECLKFSDFQGCEYSFVNNFVWHRYFGTKICKYEGFYILCSDKYGLSFNFPSGNGDVVELINKLRNYADSLGEKLVVNSVTAENIKLFEENFYGEFDFVPSEDSFDYIYKVEELADLQGKKFQKKRNHLKKIENYNYSFGRITKEDFDDCIKFAAEHYNKDNSHEVQSKVVEQYAIDQMFTHFDNFGMLGGVLRVDGKVEGFTLASRLNSNTIDIHIEKANTEINGSYPALTNMFMKSVKGEFVYANREEDLGIEGLRKSKRSYYPEYLLEKYTIKFR